MRKELLMVLVLGIFAVSCSGNSSEQVAMNAVNNQALPVENSTDTALETVGNGLGSLPSPRNVSDAPVLSVQPGTRSYMTSTAACVAFTGRGVSQPSPDFFLQFEPKLDGQMAYTFFMIDSQEDPEIDLANVSLIINWLDGVPEDSGAGFYVGIPDYERNTWVWSGPSLDGGDLLDFSGKGLGTNPGNQNFIRVALVNYSDSTAQLRQFNFTTSNPGDTSGDAAYFYITDDGTTSAIKRIAEEGQAGPEVIVNEGPGYRYRHPYVYQTADVDPLLVFDRMAPGGMWEVWQSGLDGSGLMLRHDGAGDVCTAGFTPDGAGEFVIDVNAGTLTKSSTVDNAVILRDVLPEKFNGAAQWMPTKWYEVSLVSYGANEEGEESVMWLIIHPVMDYYSYRSLTYSWHSDVVDPRDPSLVRWADGLFGYSDLVFYSARYAEGATLNIHSWIQNRGVSNNNTPYLTDEMYDLRYPAVSPDNRIISVVACEPGMDRGDLIIQSVFRQDLAGSSSLDTDVRGTGVWFDPTPVPEPTWE